MLPGLCRVADSGVLARALPDLSAAGLPGLPGPGLLRARGGGRVIRAEVVGLVVVGLYAGGFVLTLWRNRNWPDPKDWKSPWGRLPKTWKPSR